MWCWCCVCTCWCWVLVKLGTRKTPLCVRSKRLRVYGQDVSVCTGNGPAWPACLGLDSTGRTRSTRSIWSQLAFITMYSAFKVLQRGHCESCSSRNTVLQMYFFVKQQDIISSPSIMKLSLSFIRLCIESSKMCGFELLMSFVETRHVSFMLQAFLNDTCRCIPASTSITKSKELHLRNPPLSSELSGWSVLGITVPLAHQLLGIIWTTSTTTFHNPLPDLRDLVVHKLFTSAPLIALLCTCFRNCLHLRLTIWTQPPKIIILALMCPINEILSRLVDIESPQTHSTTSRLGITSANVKIIIADVDVTLNIGTLLVAGQHFTIYFSALFMLVAFVHTLSDVFLLRLPGILLSLALS